MITKRTLRWSVTGYFTIRLGSPWQLATPFLKHASSARVQFLPSTNPRILHGPFRYRDCIREEYLSHWAPTVASEPPRLFIAHVRGKYDRRSTHISQNSRNDPRDRRARS